MLILLFTLGVATGSLGGALGIGGGIVLVPLLLYVPGALGLEELDIHAVAALTIVHSFSACLAGVIVHRKLHNVHLALAVTMGSTATSVSFVAALASRHVSHEVLTVVLVAVVVLAAGLMLTPIPSADREATPEEISYSSTRALTIATFVGLLGGLVGQGGSFLVVPAMLLFLRLPTRLTIGTSLAVALGVAAAGVVGKAASGQLDSAEAFALAAGAVIGSSAGAFGSRRIPARALRLSLALVLWLTSLRLATPLVT